MTPPVKPSRSHAMSEASLYEALAAIEQRLGQKLDEGLKEMKELYKETRRATEDVSRALDKHEALEGHPLEVQRLHSLEVWREAQTQKAEQRPMQTWQVVVNVVFISLGVLSSSLSAIALIHSFIK